MTLYVGDCREVLATFAENSIDACCTDPPYELGFMGKKWDATGVAFDPETWRAVFRVLKPGAHLLAFGGTRTYHRMVCAIEDAGFEVRDQLAWIYGSGFPKSLDLGKAIDKAAGAEREIVGPNRFNGVNGRANVNVYGVASRPPETAAAADAARMWSGWGTALKPAHEPIVLARKPFKENVAQNVLAHGTGALNVDGCRIGTEEDCARKPSLVRDTPAGIGKGLEMGGRGSSFGRWPWNVLLDEEAAAALDEMSGYMKTGTTIRRNVGHLERGNIPFGRGKRSADMRDDVLAFEDGGGASRFFYVAKPDRAEREAGLEGRLRARARASIHAEMGDAKNPNHPRANFHPTVKPVELMRYLCRLITPPGGLVLDPFTGSGSTGAAAIAEGFRFVGVEKDPEYAEIARRRIAEVAPLFDTGAA